MPATPRICPIRRTIDLFQDTLGVVSRGCVTDHSDPPIEVVFQCEVLCDEDGLTVLFDHVKVIRGVYTPLEQDAVQLVSICAPRGCVGGTYVLAAYLKNSVTRLVEPLRVMA